MKLPVSVCFCGGILGFGAYYLLTRFLWNLLFDGSFLMYLILALAVYICQAWFRFQWHKPERWLRALRPENEKLSSNERPGGGFIRNSTGFCMSAKRWLFC